MTQSSTQAVVERFLDALGKGDTEAVLACLDEDVVRDVEGGGREIGRDKFRWYLGLYARWFDETASDAVIMVNGLHAAAEVTLRGTYKSAPDGWPEAHGQRYSIPAGMFFEIDDSLISRVTAYRDVERLKAELAGG